GLRISDIRSLTFNKIKDGYLAYRQTKTTSPERIKLSPNALEILKEQKQLVNENKIFNLKSKEYIFYKLREWIEKAGIKKHITFHCARHTFATLCLTYDIDLFTVSKLLGHQDIKTTQIYAKLIDKKKDEAIDKLPNL
ncbi:MAG: integrase catalytic domain-containing protein, partial [Candidatus Cloacimonetes bacterium]|nr:integrase catalytic domain-containing protein [Candidatus Cloacimonadota bacterium]